MKTHENNIQCKKSVRIWSYSSPYFPAFTLNTDQKISEYGHFSRSDCENDIVQNHEKSFL